jgi:hypothetical protein
LKINHFEGKTSNMMLAWLLSMKIFSGPGKPRRAIGVVLEQTGMCDPLQHPDVARLSVRELADMPFMRPIEITRAQRLCRFDEKAR